MFDRDWGIYILDSLQPFDIFWTCLPGCPSVFQYFKTFCTDWYLNISVYHLHQLSQYTERFIRLWMRSQIIWTADWCLFWVTFFLEGFVYTHFFGNNQMTICFFTLQGDLFIFLSIEMLLICISDEISFMIYGCVAGAVQVANFLYFEVFHLFLFRSV